MHEDFQSHWDIFFPWIQFKTWFLFFDCYVGLTYFLVFSFLTYVDEEDEISFNFHLAVGCFALKQVQLYLPAHRVSCTLSWEDSFLLLTLKYQLSKDLWFYWYVNRVPNWSSIGGDSSALVCVISFI